MVSKYLSSIIFLCLVFILVSCQDNTIVNQNKSVDKPWESSQPVNFEFEISDTINPYSFYINVRNNMDYDFSNIYFFVTTTFPDGTSGRDTVECILANVRGKWLGSGMGSIKESAHLIREDLLFPASGKYHVQLEQAMREEKLNGIEDVGIKIVKKID